MNRIYLFLLCFLAASGLTAQPLTLVYEVLPGTTGADTIAISMRNNTGSTLDLGAVNLSMAYQGDCAAISSYGSTFGTSWGSLMEFGNSLPITLDYEYSITIDGVVKTEGIVAYNQRWQYGNTDQNFASPSAVSLPANGGSAQEVLRVLVDLSSGCSTEAYLEDLSENPANEISDLAGNSVAYSIEKNADILPVEWVDFRAFQVGQGAAQLEWTTAAEVNNAGFEVEKSIDGVLFEQIGHVSGQGNATTLSGYEFTDAKASKAINFYRLRQVDFNGDFSYSEVREVRMDGSFGFHVDLYPNPAESEIHLSASLDTEQQFSLIVVDMMGKTLVNDRGVTIGGSEVVSIPVANLPAGMYTVRLLNTSYESVYSQTFLKK